MLSVVASGLAGVVASASESFKSIPLKSKSSKLKSSALVLSVVSGLAGVVESVSNSLKSIPLKSISGTSSLLDSLPPSSPPAPAPPDGTSSSGTTGAGGTT